MFIVSKIFGLMASPSSLLIFLAIVGWLASLRWKRGGISLAAAASFALALCAFSPLGLALTAALESRFPASDAPVNKLAGIIVLGGSFDTHISLERGAPELNDAADRLTVMAKLARNYPDLPIILSGGSPRLISDGAVEADLGRDVLLSFDIDPQRILLEGQSRNTRENAVLSAKLLGDRAAGRYLLVTSAYHMPRAVGSFRRAGLDVVAYPVDFRTRRPSDTWRLVSPASAGLALVDNAAKEWLGLLAYRVLGFTDALFPGPEQAPSD